MDHAKLADFHFNGARRSSPRVCCWPQPPGLAGSRVFAADGTEEEASGTGLQRCMREVRDGAARVCMGRVMGWKRAGMKYTCGAAAANARARARGAGGVELWRNVDAVDGVLGSPGCEVQGDAGRAPVWEEGERVSYKLLAMR